MIFEPLIRNHFGLLTYIVVSGISKLDVYKQLNVGPSHLLESRLYPMIDHDARMVGIFQTDEIDLNRSP